ncbi:MAG: hypothetical protein FWB96_08810 [Defluviitaleaceae bacterium]|nr:hypothetical protein [Defluviitaleaceae bacterium]MCL2264121.1 hypothetical protein [Defluviitaleaceae bacterium]
MQGSEDCAAQATTGQSVRKYIKQHLKFAAEQKDLPGTKDLLWSGGIIAKAWFSFFILLVLFAVPYFRSGALVVLGLIWLGYFFWAVNLFSRMKRQKISAFEYFAYAGFSWAYISVGMWTAMITGVITLEGGNLLLEAILLVVSVISFSIFWVTRMVDKRVPETAAESETPEKSAVRQYAFLTPLAAAASMGFGRWFFNTGIVPDEVLQSQIFGGVLVAALTLIFFGIATLDLYHAFLLWKFKLYDIKL